MENIELLLGDSLTLMERFEPRSIDCIITDPPYGILDHSIETKIQIDLFFQHAHRVLKPKSFIVFFGRQPNLTKWNVEASRRFKFKSELIWYKRNSSSITGDIRKVYENISVFQKGTRKFNLVRLPYTDVRESLSEFSEWKSLKKKINELSLLLREKSTYEKALKLLDDFSKIGSTDKSEYKPLKHLDKEFSDNHYRSTKGLMDKKKYSLINVVLGTKPTDLLSFLPHNKQQRKHHHAFIHPTVKPVQLIEYLISLCTNPDDLVLDPFMGTGTTGVACMKQGRKFLGIELVEKYFSMAKDRLNKYEEQEYAKVTSVQRSLF